MATLYSLKIENFRCIDKFEHIFKNEITCIIGRCDSGKTTILEALSMVLSSNWKLSFYDSDFFEQNTKKPILIEVTMTNLDEKLQTKHLLSLRGIDKIGQIRDDMESDDAENFETALTIRLQVNDDLEPNWYLYRGSDDTLITISASDREKCGLFYISDYSERQFSLSRGNPLYTFFKRLQEAEEDAKKDTALLNILRDAKTKIDKAVSTKFNDSLKTIKKHTINLGANIGDVEALLDQKDFTLKENNVCLHENAIPLRLKGKGTKRLLSIAIQMVNTSPNGIILIDEIEQGLEPDRVKHLVKTLKGYFGYQFIFTTHSSNVVTELEATDLYIMRNKAEAFLKIPATIAMQKCVRHSSEALFAKKIIIGEGATEVGLCRALDTNRIEKGKDSMSYLGVQILDGTGNTAVEYAKTLNDLGFKIAFLCDSDETNTNTKKQALKDIGVDIFDCEDGKAIEEQIFDNLTWVGIRKCLNYYMSEKEIDSKGLYEQIYPDKHKEYNEDWLENDTTELRTLFGKKAKKKGWYKSVTSGVMLGSEIFANIDSLNDSSHIKQMFNNLSNWIDND